MKRNKIVIGTRGSKLALWQANWVKQKLETLYPELKIEIEKKLKQQETKLLMHHWQRLVVRVCL